MPIQHSAPAPAPVPMDTAGASFVAATAAAHEAATSPFNGLPEPTEGQKRAGNYAVGRLRWHGLDLALEQPLHSDRTGVGADGKPWRSTLMAHYGYIEGTRGNDGDALDVFVGPYPEGATVWCVNQTDGAGRFDEHKFLLGFVDARHAMARLPAFLRRRLGPLRRAGGDDGAAVPALAARGRHAPASDL